MPIYKKDASKLIKKHFDRFSKEVLLYNQTISKLVKEEDDWSFVIKTHAFIEMFISEFLTKHIGDEKLERLIQRLPLSDNTIGKLRICKELGLLDKPQRKFVRFYSELRNKLVHRFENVTFSFSRYIESLNENQLKEWKNSIVWFPEEEESKQTWHKISIKDPKLALWIGIVIMASIFNLDSSRKTFKKNLNKLALETSEQLLSELTKP